MQEVNLPRHVIETFEEKWARKLQQEAPAWRSAMSPARSRTDSGVPVARRSRRPRFAAGVSSGEIMPARLSEEADRAGTCHPERIFWPLRARGSRSFPVRSSGTA